MWRVCRTQIGGLGNGVLEIEAIIEKVDVSDTSFLLMEDTGERCSLHRDCPVLGYKPLLSKD